MKTDLKHEKMVNNNVLIWSKQKPLGEYLLKI